MGTKKAPAKKTAAKKATAVAKKAAPTPAITVVGKLTDEGIECQAMRQDKTKKLFTLVPKAKLKGFKNGDHVRVVGIVPGISFCQQGTTISIKTITRVK